ncbi:MAG: HlyD family efflux transporter periplasmic adaptor subunit [Alphaproteobacteria bacterium]|nr:HlyD family efflux transporter periplasmic adaptor subunit [Alphaproteobacteria bacterium]
MKRLGRYIKILVVAVLVVAVAAIVPWPRVTSWLLATAGLRSSPTSPSVSEGLDTSRFRTAAVVRGDIVSTVQAAGTLNALVLVEVGSQISGQIKELHADFNSAVTKGQVIARIAPEIYEAKVAQSRAEVEMAENLVVVQRAQIERSGAEVANAKANFASAKAGTKRIGLALDEAARDLERKRALAKRQIVPASELERVQNAHRQAEAELSAAQADERSLAAAIRAAEAARTMSEVQLGNNQAQVKQKQALLHQAQIDLERTFIRAPITGTVINRKVSTGQTVAASLQAPTLFTIAQDLSQMQVEASIVEADVSRFDVSQPVSFTVDAYPGRQFTGDVRQVRKAPEVVQNVVTYMVIIDAENAEQLLLPGMTANLTVVVAKRDNVLKVANTALRFRPPGQTVGEALADTADSDPDAGGISGRVFVLGAEGRPMVVALRLGITDGRMTEVLAGDLTVDQRVIVGAAATARGESEGTSSLLKFRLR